MEERNNSLSNEEITELLTNQIDSLMEKVDKIPDSILNSLTETSFRDAKKILNDGLTLEKITYAIYKGYVLGIALGIEKRDDILESSSTPKQ